MLWFVTVKPKDAGFFTMRFRNDCRSTSVTSVPAGRPAAVRLARMEALYVSEPASASEAAGAPDPVVKRGVCAMLGRLMTRNFRAPDAAKVFTALVTETEAA